LTKLGLRERYAKLTQLGVGLTLIVAVRQRIGRITSPCVAVIVATKVIERTVNARRIELDVRVDLKMRAAELWQTDPEQVWTGGGRKGEGDSHFPVAE